MAPLAATAQDTGSSCGWEAGRWVCRPTQPTGFGAFTAARDKANAQGEADRRMIEQLQRQRAAQADREQAAYAARQRQALIGQVGELTDKHQCSEALSLAMKAGDLELAALVPKICTPAN
jgi:hypothetical protein